MGGAVCCQVEQAKNKFRGDLYKLQAFQPAQLPNDPIIEQWHKQNQGLISSDKNIQTNNREARKLLKLKISDTYYYCKWVNSLAQGKGYVYKPNVLFISGQFKQGTLLGTAKVNFINQQLMYEGGVKGWSADGQGILTNNKDQYQISGLWENSVPKSASFNFLKDPNVQRIHFENFKQGKGKIIYKDNRFYEGQINIKKLIPNGKGKVIFPFKSTKQQYEGDWYLGQMIGKGILKYKNKTCYDGQFYYGQKQGYGRFTYQKGNYFQGIWKNGKQNGVGAQYTLLGDVVKYGIWQNGKFTQQINKQKYNELSQIQKSKHTQYMYKLDPNDILADTGSKVDPSEVSAQIIKQTQSQYGN